MATSPTGNVTRSDVAKAAGTSVAVVSYVINNGPRPVAEATRQRVLAAIHQYLPENAPVLLEHMRTFEEYARAYDHVFAAAARAGIPV